MNFNKTEWSSVFAGLDSDRFQIGANNISYSKSGKKNTSIQIHMLVIHWSIIVPKDSFIKSLDDIGGRKQKLFKEHLLLNN